MKIKEFIEEQKKLKKSFENIDCSQLDKKEVEDIEKYIKILESIMKFISSNCDDLDQELTDDIYKNIHNKYMKSDVNRFFF